MDTAARQLRRVLFLLALVLCMAASAALATGAVTVELNNVTMNAANPYWKNGGGGSASDWNAYFDAGTSVPTLYLKDALIDIVNSFDELIYADGDIHIVLLGANHVSYTGTGAFTPAGIVVDGDLTLSDGTSGGTGGLTIDIHPGSFTFSADGILSDWGSVTIESGTIQITVMTDLITYGIYAEETLHIRGGAVTVQATGLGVSAVSVYNLNMTGGSLVSTANGEFPDSHALLFYEMLVTGGSGRFTSAGNGCGALWDESEGGDFRVTGGRMIFQSHDEALVFYTEKVLEPTVTGSIYASVDFNGLGKVLWDSSQGALAGNLDDNSDFRYVEIVGSNEQPNTGDAGRPWLWLCVGATALLSLAGVYLIFHRKRFC